jgi:hypothetical protein
MESTSTKMERIHSPERLRQLTGISQTDYDSWRRTIKGAPAPFVKFSNGDVLAYQVVSFFIHEAGVPLCDLKHLETEMIFKSCNVNFSVLKHWRLIYNSETNSLALLHEDQPNPEVKYLIRIKEAPLKILIKENIEANRKVVPIMDGGGNVEDEAALRELSGLSTVIPVNAKSSVA